jgi:hypothetical protein
LVIKTLDPDWIWIRIHVGIQPKMLDPDPDQRNTGSETLVLSAMPTAGFVAFCGSGSRTVCFFLLNDWHQYHGKHDDNWICSMLWLLHPDLE